MGLDTVELVMGIEEEFKIKIDDREAERMQTVGQVYNFILGTLNWNRGLPCRSQVAFYRLRRALMRVTSQDRTAVRPSAKLDDFFPSSGRSEMWRRLGDELGVPLPELRWPDWAVGGNFGAATVVAFYTVFAATSYCSDLILGLACGAISFVVALLIGFLFLSICPHVFQRDWPDGLSTAGELAKTLSWLDYKPSSIAPESPQSPALDDDVWPRLQHLVCDFFAVPPEQVQPHTSFVNDLGCD